MMPDPESLLLFDAWLVQRPAAQTLSLADTIALATFARLSRRDTEVALLQRGIVPERYARNLGALGLEGQIVLLQATVVVIGAGGLGGWAAEGMCRLGVGRLALVDHDVYQDSNLNRQLGCTEETLGRRKAAALAERLRTVNGAVEVIARDERLTPANAHEMLQGANVAIDALDSIHTRLLLQRATRELGIPLVHGAIAGWTGQVMTVLPGDIGLEALYGATPTIDRGIEAQTGTPSPTPMMVAAWLVQECAKLITGRGAPLRNRLLMLDALYGEVTEISLG